MHVYRASELILGIIFAGWGGLLTWAWFCARPPEQGWKPRGPLAPRMPFLALGLMQISEAFDPSHDPSDRTGIIGGTGLAVVALIYLWEFVGRRRHRQGKPDA